MRVNIKGSEREGKCSECSESLGQRQQAEDFATRIFAALNSLLIDVASTVNYKGVINSNIININFEITTK